jgi:hypothetical protein
MVRADEPESVSCSEARLRRDGRVRAAFADSALSPLGISAGTGAASASVPSRSELSSAADAAFLDAVRDLRGRRGRFALVLAGASSPSVAVTSDPRCVPSLDRTCLPSSAGSSCGADGDWIWSAEACSSEGGFTLTSAAADADTSLRLSGTSGAEPTVAAVPSRPGA